jgi:GDP-L-fucose synthase
MATVVVRPSNVYGPRDKFDFERSHVTAALLRRVVERHEPLEVWGTGLDERDLIYVDDFIDGALRAFAATDRHETYNIASGQVYSVRELVKILCDLDRFHDARVQYRADRPTTLGRRIIATEKAERALGFRAETTLADGLHRTLTWYRQHRFPHA